MGIIEYYEGDNKWSGERKADMKRLAKKWLNMLNKEYDAGNRVGSKKLYDTLKYRAEENGDADTSGKAYPSRPFVEDFIQRQKYSQTHKRIKTKSDTIQAVLASRPNQLLQVDYLYFYWATDGIEDKRKDGPWDEAELSGTELTKVKAGTDERGKIFKKKKLKYRGAIVAVDGFSRFAYVKEIQGNINSDKAKGAMIEILSDATERYPGTKPRVIQTDLGSEFLGEFRELLKRKADDNKGFYKHLYGYTGRSQTQGIVERVNQTLKRLLMKALGDDLDKNWVPALRTITRVYNSNYHSTIKRAPKDITNDSDLEEIKQNIYDKAYKKGFITNEKFGRGDYVRIRVFKPKRLEPTFSSKGGLPDTLARDADPDLKEELQGVYMVHDVRKGRNYVREGPNAANSKPGRATTYRIVHTWPKQTKTGTVPSGQKAAGAGVRLEVNESRLFTGRYPTAAYGRNFTASELTLVPQDKQGLPIVEERATLIVDEGDEEDEQYVIEKILSRQKVTKGSNKGRFQYTIKYQGYDEPEKGFYEDVAGTAALDKFLAKNPPEKLHSS
eukprot:SAG22_NODE_462_length_10207_cov_30.708647_2_plen_556_part_00